MAFPIRLLDRCADAGLPTRATGGLYRWSGTYDDGVGIDENQLS
ncbi:hypothetical protein [Nocardia alni]|nr:hypothetical protein [Nocardia alni]